VNRPRSLVCSGGLSARDIWCVLVAARAPLPAVRLKGHEGYGFDHCVPGCGNIVRTDHHATALRDRADALDKQATHVPQPISERLRDHAERLRGIVDTHDRTRITLKDTTP
jgi:hypothetical protein